MVEMTTIERCGGMQKNEHVEQPVVYLADVTSHFDYRFNIRISEITWI